MYFRFQNRAQAGRFLADKLEAYAGRDDVVVLGLPRGGIPVAFEVARQLRAPLAPFLVRKLGVPHHEELAMGAIASGGVCILNDRLIEHLNIAQRKIDEVIDRETRELARREELYRVAPMPELRGRIVIIIDDGLATGASMRAAVTAAREQHPARIIVAAPVAARETCRGIRGGGGRSCVRANAGRIRGSRAMGPGLFTNNRRRSAGAFGARNGAKSARHSLPEFLGGQLDKKIIDDGSFLAKAQLMVRVPLLNVSWKRTRWPETRRRL